MTEAIATSNDHWLILTDYASKYKISVSTLRRRIKNNQIQFRFDNGKYLILDEAPSDVVAAHPGVPSARMMASYEPSLAHLMAQAAPIESTPQTVATEDKIKELGQGAAQSEGEGPLISTATRLLNELKRAYTNILQEKEEQMILLKEEVADLKTLVRVLESDNDRMRGILQKWGSA